MRIVVIASTQDHDRTALFTKFMQKHGHSTWTNLDLAKDTELSKLEQERRIDFEIESADVTVAFYHHYDYDHPVLRLWDGSLLYGKPFCFIVPKATQIQMYRYVGVRQIIAPHGNEAEGFHELQQNLENEALIRQHLLFTYIDLPTNSDQKSISESTATTNTYREKLIRYTWDPWITRLQRDEVRNTQVNLGIQLRPDALLRSPQAQTAPLPSDTDIYTLFKPSYADRNPPPPTLAKELLILGDPGSGKTYILLQLAKKLLGAARLNSTMPVSDDADKIKRQSQKEIVPVPMIFRLATWDYAKTIRDWMIAELIKEISLNQQEAEQAVDQGVILPLFDGLDEVSPMVRDSCVEALNRFKQHLGYRGMVVCSRTQDYLNLSERLDVTTAIEIQPLSLGQGEDYLLENVTTVSAFRLHQKNQIVQSLAASPFVLTAMAEGYQNLPPSALVTEDEPNQRIAHILGYFVQQRYQSYKGAKPYTLEQVNTYLSRIARHIVDNPYRHFELGISLSSDYLESSRDRIWFSLLSSVLTSSFTLILVFLIDTALSLLPGYPSTPIIVKLMGITGLLISINLILVIFYDKMVDTVMQFLKTSVDSDSGTNQLSAALAGRVTATDWKKVYDMLAFSKSLQSAGRDHGLYISARLMALASSIAFLRIAASPIWIGGIVAVGLVITLLILRLKPWYIWLGITLLICLWIGFLITTPIISLLGVVVITAVELIKKEQSVLNTDMGSMSESRSLQGYTGFVQNLLDSFALVSLGIIPIFFGPIPGIIGLIPDPWRGRNIGPFVLRTFLAARGYLPRNIQGFLDYCEALGLVRKTGKNAYIFSHRFLLEYYAHPEYVAQAEKDYEARIQSYNNLPLIKQTVQQLTQTPREQQAIYFDTISPAISRLNYLQRVGLLASRLIVRSSLPVSRLVLNLASRLTRQSTPYDWVQQHHRRIRRAVYNLEITLYPHLPYAYSPLSATYVEVEDFEQAYQVYSRCLEASPTAAFAYRERGRIRYQQNRFAEAQEEVGQALKHNAKDSETHYLLGQIGWARYDFATALEGFKQAVALMPTTSDYHYQTGYVAYTCNNLPLALYHFDEAVEYSGDELNWRITYSRGRAYVLQELKEHEAVLDDFNYLLARYNEKITTSDYADLIFERALSQLALGDYSAALVDLELSITSAPDNYYNLYRCNLWKLLRAILLDDTNEIPYLTQTISELQPQLQASSTPDQINTNVGAYSLIPALQGYEEESQRYLQVLLDAKCPRYILVDTRRMLRLLRDIAPHVTTISAIEQWLDQQIISTHAVDVTM